MPTKIILFIFVFLFPVCIFAQDDKYLHKSTIPYSDSLKKAFKKEKYLKQLIKIVRLSIYNLNTNKLNRAESHQLLKYFQTEINNKRQINKILPYIQNGLGIIYSYTPEGKIMAADYLLNTLPYIEAQKDEEWLTKTYGYIGKIFYNIEDFRSALKYFEESKKHNIKLYVPISEIISLHNTYGLVFQKLNKPDSAIYHYKKGLDNATEKKDTIWIGILKGNIGTMLYKQKRYAEALPLLEADVKMSIANKLFANAVISLADVIRIYMEQKDLTNVEKRLAHFSECIKKMEEDAPMNFIAYSNYYEVLASYYESIQENTQALYYHKLLQQAEKDHRKYIKEVDVQRIKFKYDDNLKQQNVEKLTKQNENQKIYLYAVGISLLALLLLIVILGQRFYQKNVLMNKLQTQHVEIKQINEELLQNVEQISVQSRIIEMQNEALQASNLSKDKIFTLISHDLRSPLAGLKGVLYLLKNDYMSAQELQTILPTIENNLDVTLNLTEELLYWAKTQMEGMRASPSSLNPQAIIEQTIANIDKAAQTKGVRLQAGKAINKSTLWADENMVKAVLRNLIANAVKFCSAKQEIRVSAVETTNNLIQFSVADTGTGMKPELLAKMFQNQPVTTIGTSGEKGTGFGLMMCKDFITQNDGKIWVESVWGEGSSFHFTLPTIAN